MQKGIRSRRNEDHPLDFWGKQRAQPYLTASIQATSGGGAERYYQGEWRGREGRRKRKKETV